jgi:hypothetical protein
MIAPGSYVEEINGKEAYQQGNLLFWGEWEPPSEVRPLLTKEEVDGVTHIYADCPNLHKPYLSPQPFPKNTPDEKNPYQNTDPFVFGDQFRYAICKQSGGANIMPRLDKGSLILFGNGQGTGENAGFALDTVFVVAGYWEFNVSNTQTLLEDLKRKYKDAELYYKIVIELACSCAGTNAIHRCYYGAIYEDRDQYDGMYSFVPAHKTVKTFEEYKATDKGFPRVWLGEKSPFIANSGSINLNLKQGLKATERSSATIKAFWQNIRQLSRDQGFVEGVHFDMPPTL